jgi:uncharacterized protein (TIGR00297 family)
VLTIITGIVLNFAGAYAAARMSALSRNGAVAAFVVGTAVFVGIGLPGWILLMTFFVSSTALGKVQNDAKKRASTIHEKGASRDAVQVVANGGVAAVAAVAFSLSDARWAVAAFVSAMAAATADTWGGEIGMLSSRRPRSILTFNTVPVGQSGGVTFLGTTAAALGAVFVGLIAAGMQLALAWASEPSVRFLLLSAGAGFLGALVDSVLGTTLQARYIDGAGNITEKSGNDHTLVAGARWVTNDVVNFASTATAGIVGALLILAFD